MILKLFAIRDSKTASFGNPMVLQSEGQCVRLVSDQVNGVSRSGQEENVLTQHPEDFEVFSLGEYDTDTGIITSVVKSVVACGALKVGGPRGVADARQ